MRNLLMLLSLSGALVACATPPPLEAPPDELVPAARLPDPPKPVEVVEVPTAAAAGPAQAQAATLRIGSRRSARCGERGP